MESLDLTCKLVDLKIKSKALDQIYFYVSSMTKGKKYENQNLESLVILLPPFPSPDVLGGGGGGGCCIPPPLPNFFHGKIFKFFFHRYMGI